MLILRVEVENFDMGPEVRALPVVDNFSLRGANNFGENGKLIGLEMAET